ncbi:Coa1 protein [Saccharomycopsis crataegensis]|uniref:Coa1 protein n=1 Tax=Saccharomycopsis crataegensis TaxID=43959 RepID=A0AAV5QRY3_9ASCO|nr:Coa1 protein [Saccharomycopsis crataegensis]
MLRSILKSPLVRSSPMARGGVAAAFRAPITATTKALTAPPARWQSTAAPVTQNIFREDHQQKQVKKPMTVNTELPDPLAEKRKVRLQFCCFVICVTVGFFMIVNYEKFSSPIIGSTMHFLRRSDKVKEVLGKNIDFTSAFPWISGEFNQVKGKIDISFKIKGDNGKIGVVKLVANRPNKSVPLTIDEWSVTVDDVKYDLIDDDSAELVN